LVFLLNISRHANAIALRIHLSIFYICYTRTNASHFARGSICKAGSQPQRDCFCPNHHQLLLSRHPQELHPALSESLKAGTASPSSKPRELFAARCSTSSGRQASYRLCLPVPVQGAPPRGSTSSRACKALCFQYLVPSCSLVTAEKVIMIARTTTPLSWHIPSPQIAH